jgi:flagellar M-ring protein FliF
MGAIRPALKVMAQPAPPRTLERVGQVDAVEGEEPDRPLLAAPGASGVPKLLEASPADLALEDARKLTRDNPAAVANIVKTWINGEAPA